MKQFISDYLNFSKKERRGHIVLLCLTALVFMAPHVLPMFNRRQPRPADDALKQALAGLTVEKDTTSRSARRYQPDNYRSYARNNHQFRRYWENDDDEEDAIPGRLFHFDPNTLSDEGWRQLGVRDKTIATIKNYLAKGGHFYKPEDIDRIYGLSDRLAEALIPYVQIAADSTRGPGRLKDTVLNTGNFPRKSSTLVLDINTADTNAYKSLPGIGSGWARRIVNFRDKLGGFYSVKQLGETRGLPDSVFQKIQAQLVCNADMIKKIDINLADTAELRRHPYISSNLANNWVQYRRQHGRFLALADLKKMALMKDDIYEKLEPYLKLE